MSSTTPLSAARPPREAAIPELEHLVTASLAAHRARTAVEVDGRSVTYAELDERSAAVADLLGAAGSGSGPVAILAGYDDGVVAAVLGAVRGGRPFAVLDPVLPAARLRQILEQSQSAMVLTDAAHAEVARAVAGPAVPVRRIDELTGRDAPTALPVAADDAPAAIVFTSGSTGAPKGVVWSRRLCAADAVIIGEICGYEPGARVALSLPVAYAAGLASLLASLVHGVTLCMLDVRAVGAVRYARWLDETAAEIVHLTPSMARGIFGAMRDGETAGSLRLATLCGESLYGRDVALVRAHGPADVNVLQWFGSSETGTISSLLITAHDPVPDGRVPAGIPVRWTRVRLLTPEGTDAPEGTSGELIVSSVVVTDGYWNAPAASAAKVRRGADGWWDVRTGDIARVGADGVVDVLGRADAAVKIRGYLVDPSEIEAALLKHDDVAEAVVVARREGQSTVLAAYVAPPGGSRAPSVPSVRTHLAATLPAWMIPRHVVVLPTLPTNDRGKVDRAGLPAVPERVVDAPETATEERLAAIWAEVLGVDEVGRNDDFFALGGDSLAAEELIVRVRDELHVPLSASELAVASSLGALAARVDDGQDARGAGVTRGRQRAGARAAVFCMPGGGASAATLGGLLSRLPGDVERFVIVQRGHERRGLPEWSIHRTVGRRVRAIRQARATGPYVIVGHSFGALLALGVARRLREQGEDATAVLIDPFLKETRAGDPYSPPRSAWDVVRGPAPSRWRTSSVRTLLELPFAVLLPIRLETREWHLYLIAQIAARLHRPVPFDGPALVYRTAQNGDPQSLWDEIVPRRDVDRALDCDHLSVLKPPHVDVVAADIAAVLR